MRVCQSGAGGGRHGAGGHGGSSCGFFGSGGYLLYEITEGQVCGRADAAGLRAAGSRCPAGALGLCSALVR